MLRTLAVTMLALSVVIPRLAHAEDQKPPAVRIKSFAFEPATIRVKAGSVVEWGNQDYEPHTVTADDDAFKSRALDTGSRFAFTFERSGRFTYHCALHPHMTGAVVVE